MSVVCRHLGSSAPTNSLKCNDQPSLSLVGPPPGESLPKPEGHVHLDFLVNGLLARRLKLAPTWFIFALPITEGHGRVGHASGYWLVPRNKIVPIGDLGHLLTLTLTSDDLESDIVVNDSSTLTSTTIWFVAALSLIVDVRTDGHFYGFITSSLRR